MDKPILYTYLASPIGRLLVTAEAELLTGLYMPGHRGSPAPQSDWQQSDAPFTIARWQLEEYFAGRRQQFDLPLRMAGSEFQQRVWRALVQIPFGTTITYAQLAARIDRAGAARAVGHANSRNPISIIVPCHRVIGADGTLAGYAGGLDKKRWLLDLERSAMTAQFTARDAEPQAKEAHSWFGSTEKRPANMAAKSGRS